MSIVKKSNLPTRRTLFPTLFGESYDPFERFESLFNSMLGEHPMFTERMGQVDVQKDEKNYYFQVDVPGLTKEDIKINIEDGCISISGERKPKEKKEGQEYVIAERSYRRFERQFCLPEDIDLETIDAKIDNGVLSIVIGRKEQKKTGKTVEVK